MRFIILFVLALITAESRAQLTSNKLFLNKDFQVTTMKNEILYRVNQTIINSSPKTWIDSIFNQNKIDSTTLVRVNKYEIAGNDTLLNGVNSRLLNSQSNSQEMGHEKEKGTIDCELLSNKIPVFKYNDTDLNYFLVENMIYPEDARKKNKECQVVLIFIINKDGSISDIQASNCDNASLVNEAIRVISLTSGYWRPGESCGKTTRTRVKIPIIFSLE
jgi:TonB family protein